MLIFLYGADSYRSQEHLKKLVEKFKKERDPQSLNVHILDCEKIEDKAILEELGNAPFLAEKKLIILKKLLTTAKKGDLQTTLLEKIKNKKISDDNIVIFWEEDLKPKTNVAKELYSLLTKEKFSQEFIPFTGTKLTTWINTLITENNAKISQKALDYLVSNIGNDPWLLNSLIKQLASYKIGEEITVEDIKLFLPEKIDDSIFNLVDAIIAKQKSTIFSMIKEQYRLGKDPLYILAMLTRQIKILLQIRDEFEKNDVLKSDELAKKLGIHPFVIKKSLPLVKHFTKENLLKIYQDLLALDTQIKTGLEDQSLLLDLLVSKLCL
ncbi:MAG: polymerase III, delta subunit protein [Candidatus Magasanikbacteria bacterium GW2011_GWC2_37_14]|uniref:DNA polymerase III subunit delta n=1 Tax=Candidatus Magasanikbacteria bacterium GW2011_GWC2_37_14 TaxID=1619046 RepID=A0A0G0GMW2_9BACT|nr:MAG: polymerase III, delta subunit protein [Candidatus Magasanikbacteria bacterium GW2011_GWC2_37_14]